MRWYLVIYFPIIARSSTLPSTIEQKVRSFASVVDERSDACLPALLDIMRVAVNKFSVTDQDTSGNIHDFVQRELIRQGSPGSTVPTFCRVSLVFRSISREYVQSIMDILSAPANAEFKTDIQDVASRVSQKYVKETHVRKLLKSFHIAFEVLGPVMRKYAKLTSSGWMTLTCKDDPRLKDIILRNRIGFLESATVESTVWFLKMLSDGDSCYRELSGQSPDPDSEPASFEDFSAEFQAAVNVGTEPSPPVSVSVDPTVVSGSSLSQTTLVRSEKSKPSLRTPDTHPRHIVDQSFRSLSIVNQETIFFGNLQEVVYKISVLNHESMNAVVHIRTLESYTMVLIKALDHLNQLQKSHKNIDDKLTAVLGDLRTAIDQSGQPAPKDV